MKFEGIPGGSTDEQHKGEVEALSFNWSAKLKDDAAGPAAEMHDALVLKPIDAATPGLMLALASGKTIPQVTVTVRGTVPGGKAQAEYLRYTFTDVRLTAVSHAVVNRRRNRCSSATPRSASATRAPTARPPRKGGTPRRSSRRRPSRARRKSSSTT